jgi:hypothetical protein
MLEKKKFHFAFPKPSDQSGTLASLDNNNKNESSRPEQFICPYLLQI